jgi:prophage regulatory protein
MERDVADRDIEQQRDSGVVADERFSTASSQGALTRRLIPPAVVTDRTSLSRTTIWRMVRRGEFPAPIQISPGRVAWSEAAVDAWIASKTVAA